MSEGEKMTDRKTKFSAEKKCDYIFQKIWN